MVEQMHDIDVKFGRPQEVGHWAGHEEQYVISPGRSGPILYVIGFLLVLSGGIMLAPALIDLSSNAGPGLGALIGPAATVKGSNIGSCVPIRDVPRYVELYRQGRLPVDRLLSERVRLDELNESFDRLASGRTIRQVLVV